MVIDSGAVKLSEFRQRQVISVRGNIHCFERSGTDFQSYLKELKGKDSVIYIFEGAKLDLGGLVSLLLYTFRNKDANVTVCGERKGLTDVAEVYDVSDFMYSELDNLRFCNSCLVKYCPFRRA